MADQYLTVRTPDGKHLCVSPLPQSTFEQCAAEDLDDHLGYFLYEYDPATPGAGIAILAKAASLVAALRLLDIYSGAATQVAA